MCDHHIIVFSQIYSITFNTCPFFNQMFINVKSIYINFVINVRVCYVLLTIIFIMILNEMLEEDICSYIKSGLKLTG